MSFLFSSARPLTGFRSIAQSKRGFALLITVTLLAFLVLLLVSLAALTRVETQVAANTQTIAQARQNAMMALNIALGQLQKYAGPDARVTAQAAITSTGSVTNPNLTGVWDTSGTGPGAETWLVSGSEATTATAADVLSGTPDPSIDTVTNDTLFLVGNQSVAADTAAPTAAERVQRIKVTKQDIVVPTGSVPGLGTEGTTRIGRYAWWVGDQGIKASLALSDRADEVNYAPWYDATPVNGYDQRARIRQQIGSGPNYFRTGSANSLLTTVSKAGFDPLDAANVPRLKTLVSPVQLSYLTSAGGMVTVANFVKGHYHDFTSAAYGVLANTRPASDPYRGLMGDLSLKPDALGSAFAAYADYTSYMETPGGNAPGITIANSMTPIPAITDGNSPRRRYKMMPPVDAAATDLPDIRFSVAPVLASFYLQFGLSKPSATSGVLNVQSRLFVTLWNPYAAGLAPASTNGLSIDVELPTITAEGFSIDLNSSPASKTSGGVGLPFGASARHNDSQNSNTYGAAGEMATWLPGRSYSWTTNPDTMPNAGTALGFYSNVLSSSWAHLALSVPTTLGRYPALEIPAAIIKVHLKLNGAVIATYEGQYDSQSAPAASQLWRFGYAFRINQPRVNSFDRRWLQKFDPRTITYTQPSVVATDSPVIIPFCTDSSTSSMPLVYSDTNAKTTSTTGGTLLTSPLIYRVQGVSVRAMSVYNDASLFELPRLPLLSTGELQQLQVKDKPAYSIGNSWGGAANIVFDRFFFSGLPKSGTHPDLTSAKPEPLPNWNLVPVNGTTLAVLRSDANPANASLSSRYLLQGGSFNLNSTSVAAWRAVFSSVRFGASSQFAAAGVDNTLTNSSPYAGTQNGAATQSQSFNVDTSLGSAPAPVFFHFPQSAQEVFYWAKPTGSSSNDRLFSTSAFRIGVRGYNDSTVTNGFAGESGTFTTAGAKGSNRQHITTDQIEVLATEIVSRIKTRTSSKGPYRNLQEFLSEIVETDASTTPNSTYSLLEAAIKASGINAAEVTPKPVATNLTDPGFSPMTLTQADLLNAMAPYLRNRSDTFVVRAYGETVNPVVGTTSAQAWVEATVQRFPETVDSGDSISQPAQAFGRRFKIISFRWLTPNDI